MVKTGNIGLIIILLLVLLLTGCKDQSVVFDAEENSENTSNETEEMTQEVIVKPHSPEENETKVNEAVLENSEESAEEPAVENFAEDQPSSEELVDSPETQESDFEEVTTVEAEDTQNNRVSIQVISPVEELMSASISLETDDSVFDVLLRASEEVGLRIDYTGRGQLAYLQGIENIYEFDYGANSGWLYAVNGELPAMGMGNYFPEAGDEILIQYTLDGGYDIGSR